MKLIVALFGILIIHWMTMKLSPKQISQLSDSNQIVLSTIRAIPLDEPCILLKTHLNENYAAYNTEPGNALERVYLSLYTSILQQRRLIFGLGRRSMQSLIKADPNYKVQQESFGDHSWPMILQVLYNDFKLIKQLKQGQGGSVSIFEVVDTDVVEYLSALVNIEEQRKQSIEFSTNIVRK